VTKEEQLHELILGGEGQTVEFKASFATTKQAIQTMVAFANSQGGTVFFGLENDGRARGVDIGENRLERLASAIRDHTYPSLPVDFDEAFPYGGKRVLSVEAPRDVPPVVGVYLYSGRPIPSDKPVEVSGLQAFRRVGKMNQKEDFMRLRRPQPSDPRLRLQVKWAAIYTDNPTCGALAGQVWAEEGSGTAHQVTFRLDPFGCESDTHCDDLPYPSLKGPDRATSIHDFRYEGFTRAVDFEFRDLDFSTVPETAVITATYGDDWGLTWEARRRISLSLSQGRDRPDLEWLDSGGFRRRIVAFPPKMET
jgi:hypothetical protein